MDTRVQEKPSLLLIEENGMVLDSLLEWLRMAFPDVRLIESSDYSNGIYLSRSESPDVVLIDISNLGRSGIESIQNLKAAQPDTAVFALISLEHESYQQAVCDAGAEACACIWKLRTELLPRLEQRLLPEGAQLGPHGNGR